MRRPNIYIKFDKLLAKTAKAYRLRWNGQEFWIPKALCRQFITNNKLGGNCYIAAFKYEEITGIKLDDMPKGEVDELSDVVIERHIPVKIEPKNILPYASLVR